MKKKKREEKKRTRKNKEKKKRRGRRRGEKKKKQKESPLRNAGVTSFFKVTCVMLRIQHLMQSRCFYFLW